MTSRMSILTGMGFKTGEFLLIKALCLIIILAKGVGGFLNRAKLANSVRKTGNYLVITDAFTQIK